MSALGSPDCPLRLLPIGRTLPVIQSGAARWRSVWITMLALHGFSWACVIEKIVAITRSKSSIKNHKVLITKEELLR